MCANYEAIKLLKVLSAEFNVEPPPTLGELDMWPTYKGVCIRRPLEADSGDDAVPARECLPAVFGLVPHWVRTDKDAKTSSRKYYNARSETAATIGPFRTAWSRAHHCLVPAQAIYEPDYREDERKPKSARIEREDGKPMGLAGLWWEWKSPESGVALASFTLLTVNADSHPLMRNFHRPGKEKRMPVILHDDAYDAWLQAPANRSMEFMRQYQGLHQVTATSSSESEKG